MKIWFKVLGAWVVLITLCLVGGTTARHITKAQSSEGPIISNVGPRLIADVSYTKIYKVKDGECNVYVIVDNRGSSGIATGQGCK